MKANIITNENVKLKDYLKIRSGQSVRDMNEICLKCIYQANAKMD